MGAVVGDEEEIVCSDGVVMRFVTWTSTQGVDSGGGRVSLESILPDGRRISLDVPGRLAADPWLHRLYDAIAADPSFRDSLVGTLAVDAGFHVPDAPARGGGLHWLVRLGPRARFKDYASCKSGRDAHTTMKLPALREAVGPGRLAAIQAAMASGPDADVAKVLRWVLRGLPPAMAVRKVAVDAEVGEAARGRG